MDFYVRQSASEDEVFAFIKALKLLGEEKKDLIYMMELGRIY